MEKSLHLNTSHRVAWMACGFVLLATATFSESVRAAVVVVERSVPQVYKGYGYKNQYYYGGAKYKRNRYGRSRTNRNGGVNSAGVYR